MAMTLDEFVKEYGLSMSRVMDDIAEVTPIGETVTIILGEAWAPFKIQGRMMISKCAHKCR